MHHAMSVEMKKCIDACQKCHNICVQTAMTHPFEVEAKHLEGPHLGIMWDCAEMCQIAANLMLRGSHFYDQACQLCGSIADACALLCEHIKGLAECTQVCRRCAEHCRQMVETTVV